MAPETGGLPDAAVMALSRLRRAGCILYLRGLAIEADDRDGRPIPQGHPDLAALNAPDLLAAVLEATRPADDDLAVPPLTLLDALGAPLRILTAADDVLAALDTLSRADQPIGFDFETRPTRPARVPLNVRLDGRFHAGGAVTGKNDDKGALSPHTGTPRVLSFAGPSGPTFVVDLERVPLAEIAPAFEDLHVIGHNTGFDVGFLMAHGDGAVPAKLDDTMLLDAGTVGRRRGLDDVAQSHLGLRPSKRYQAGPWIGDLSVEQLAYAAADAVLAQRLYTALGGKTVFSAPWYRADADAVVAVAEMELTGLPLNTRLLGQVDAALGPVVETARAAFTEATGVANPNSAPQLSAWLTGTDPATGEPVLTEDEMDEWPRTDAGQLSTGKDALLRFPEVPGVADLIRLRKVEKLSTTYGQPLLSRARPDPNSNHIARLHGRFILGGARSGRLASSQPSLQNLPCGDFRKIIEAPAGRKIAVLDYRNIEIAVGALLYPEPDLLQALHEQRNLHAEMGALLTGLSLAQVTKGTAAYNLGKVANFGTQYGCGPRGFQAQARAYGVAITHNEAQDYLQRIHRERPGMVAWFGQQEQAARASRYAATVLGRRVSVYGPRKGAKSWERPAFYRNRAFNIPIQGSAAEAMKIAIAIAGEQLAERDIDGRLIACVHDELVCETSAADADAVADVMNSAMQRGFAAVFDHLPGYDLVAPIIVPDATIADTWEGDRVEKGQPFRIGDFDLSASLYDEDALG